MPDHLHPGAIGDRAVLMAMGGGMEEARTLLDIAVAAFRELGRPNVGHAMTADVERLAGNHEAAADAMLAHCAYLSEHGLEPLLSTYASESGRELCALRRYDEAEQLAGQGRDLGSDDDPVTQSLWRGVMAVVLAHRGDLVEAERLAREAVAIANTTDSPWRQADVLCDLAEVLDLAGRPGEAVAAYRSALEQYERKGIVPLAARTRERIALLVAPREA